MDTIDEAMAAAKRSLGKRIEQYLELVERERMPMGPWETDQLCKAMACLETGSYGVGEEVMSHLERADAYRTPEAIPALTDGPTLTVEEHRATLERISEN